MTRLRTDQRGFSAVETVLVVIIVAAIAGVGFYVYHQKQQANDTLSNSTGTSTQANPPTGTTANISQLTEQDAQTEAGVDHAADNQTSQAATSANGAVTNVGGAYNETSL